MISLQHRLNRSLACTLLLIFFGHWVAADWIIRLVAENEIETRLEHDGDTLLATLRMDEQGHIQLSASRVGLIYDQKFSGHYFCLRTNTETHLSPSAQGETWAIPSIQPGQRVRYHAEGPHRQPVLVLTRGFHLEGQNIGLSVAEDLTEIGREIFHLRMGYLGLTVIILMGAIALQSVDVRRSLRPIKVIRDELQAVSRGEKTFMEATAPPEIEPLVEEINRLLVLVERRLQQSRTAIGNLAHALKTPLAILFRAADNPVLADHPDQRRRIREQTLAMHNRIERELKRARLAGDHKSGAVFNPREDLSALIEILKQAYIDKALQFELNAPDQPLHHDRQDMLELIGNLADNACKWAATTIRIDIYHGEEHLWVKVSDDGPGCPDSELKNLTRRGLRLDESIQGHGLGLAIVRDMVDFYGGRLVLGRSSALGGLEISIQI
jgi:signal transduction histidine kinase